MEAAVGAVVKAVVKAVVVSFAVAVERSCLMSSCHPPTHPLQKPIVRRYEEVSGSFLTSLAGLRGLRSLALKHLHTAGEPQLRAGLAALTGLTRLEVRAAAERRWPGGWVARLRGLLSG